MKIQNVLEIVNNTKKVVIYKGDLYHYFRFLLTASSNNNPYHNLVHSCYVLEKTYEAALYSGLFSRNVRNLLIAAMFHDYGHSGKIGHEDKEIEKALYFLREIILPEDKSYTESIASLILATKYPYQEDEDLNEAALILRDADLSQILDNNWFELCVIGLSQEMGLGLKEMLKENIRFLKDLKFQSSWGKAVLQKKVVPRLHEIQYLYHNAMS